jgi:hypothetical protein
MLKYLFQSLKYPSQPLKCLSQALKKHSTLAPTNLTTFRNH